MATRAETSVETQIGHGNVCGNFMETFMETFSSRWKRFWEYPSSVDIPKVSRTRTVCSMKYRCIRAYKSSGNYGKLRIAKTKASAARAKTAVYKASVIANNAFHVGTSTGIRVLVEFMDYTDADSLRSPAEHLVDALEDPAAIILGSCPGEDLVSLVAAFSLSVVSLGIEAGKFIGPIAKMCGGGGGGRPNFAQAGGRKPENLASALEKAKADLISVSSEKTS